MSEKELRTHKWEPRPVEGLPVSVWDPSWETPEIARRVALLTYSRVSHLPFDTCTLLSPDVLPELSPKHTEHRRFDLRVAEAIEPLGCHFRGGSWGEIFRKYSFGPRRFAAFHAQAVAVGADSKGRFFIDATVGVVGGSVHNKAALAVRFKAENRVVGGVAWEGPVESNQNMRVQILGEDRGLEESFDSLTELEVDFYSHCPGPDDDVDEREKVVDDEIFPF